MHGGGAVDGLGDARGKGLHVGGLVGDALVSGLAFVIVNCAGRFFSIAPERERDITGAVEREEVVEAATGVGDVGCSADEVV